MPLRVWLGGTVYAVSALADAVLPLEAVIEVRTGGLSDAGAASLLRLVETAPWSPIVAEAKILPQLRAVLSGLPVTARLLSAVEAAAWEPTRIAISDAPTLDEFLQYVATRIGSTEGQVVRGLFAEWGGTAVARRRLRRHALPQPNDWYDLWLAIHARATVAPSTAALAAAARVRRVTPATLNAQSHRLFGLSWGESAAVPWRGRVERFLRAAGLPLRPARRVLPPPRDRRRRLRYKLRQVGAGPCM